MKTLLFSISIIICALGSLGQSPTRTYVQRADSLFQLKISPDNFKKGTVFLTLDTIHADSPSIYIESDNPKVIIRHYKRFIKSLQIEGSYYNYYELINSPFFASPLNISFLMNTKDLTYLVRIWTDKKNTSKIEGITVSKYSIKLERTPW